MRIPHQNFASPGNALSVFMLQSFKKKTICIESETLNLKDWSSRCLLDGKANPQAKQFFNVTFFNVNKKIFVNQSSGLGHKPDLDGMMHSYGNSEAEKNHDQNS